MPQGYLLKEGCLQAYIGDEIAIKACFHNSSKLLPDDKSSPSRSNIDSIFIQYRIAATGASY